MPRDCKATMMWLAASLIDRIIIVIYFSLFFFFQAEDGIRDIGVTGVQTCALPIFLIKIQSSGVCHSDVHVWEGYYEGIGGQPLKTTDRGVKYPLTPGHEIAGKIGRASCRERV